MIICDYCNHYATCGYCDSCPYGSLLEANLKGEFTDDWTEESAVWELEQLRNTFGWDDPPYKECSLQELAKMLKLKNKKALI